MKPDQQIQLIQRMQALVANNTSELMDQEHFRPMSDYADAELFRKEQVIMRQHPMVLAYSSEIAKPGDFITHEHAGIPIVITRSKDGKVHGFYNICRHRGSKIATQNQGNCRVLVCPYHSWTYDLEGRLIGMPDSFGFPQVNYKDHGLIEIPVEERHGCIWGMLDHHRALDLDAYLGPQINEDLENFGLKKHVFYKSVVMQRKMNWKIAIELFLEGYHFNYAHKASISEIFYNNKVLFDRFEQHLRYIFIRANLPELPQDQELWRVRDVSVLIYLLFPNTYIFFQPDHINFLHIFPKSVDETVIISTYLLPEIPTTQKALDYWNKNIDLFQKVMDEDLGMGEGIQHGASCGTDNQVVFGQFEQGLYFFRTEVDKAVASGSP